MPGVGFTTWEPKSCPTVFIVKNIAPGNKRIRIFNVPIGNGLIRDLMDIPVVSEADIRHSLLKGELNTKIKYGEAIVVDSNIDLLQFDECQKTFLTNAGIIKGLEISGSANNFVFRENISLIGEKNGVNRIFMTPEDFLNGTLDDNEFSIRLRHNGRGLIENCDYVLLESGGVGTGFDTIQIIGFVPSSHSTLIADYVIGA